MPIHIDANTIIGELKHPIARIVNLSSCPKEMLNIMLMRIPNLPENISHVNVSQQLMYSLTDTKLTALPKRKAAIFVIDEDSKYADMMVNGMKKMMNVVCADKIIFKQSKMKHEISGRRGVTRSFCSHQHKDEILRGFGINTLALPKPEDIMLATVIRTTGCYIDSVNGLIATLTYLGIPVQIELREVKLAKTWLLLDRKGFEENYEMENPNNNDFTTLQTKRNALTLIGYTDMISTERGFKKFRNRTQKKHTLKSILIIIIRIIKGIVKWLITALKWILSKILWWPTGPKKGKLKKKKNRDKKNV